MEPKPITIRVSEEAARAYETASPEDQRKLNALLSLELSEVRLGRKSLEDVVAEISREAQKRGLTPEVLESLLNEQ